MRRAASDAQSFDADLLKKLRQGGTGVMRRVIEFRLGDQSV
jgi:hypothetical protein